MAPTPNTDHDPAERYHAHMAAAFVRARLGLPDQLEDSRALQLGQERGLKLHKFKRSSLARVERVLGALRGLHPASLLDIGSGRGAALWPLLEAFPELPVTALELDQRRVDDLRAVRDGGVCQLSVEQGTLLALRAEAGHFEVVTILEVLEHLESPLTAAREALRVASRFVIASVPSKADSNPGHLRLFSEQSLTALFLDAGAARVSVDYVLNHMIAIVRV
jgi:ubiquinone/menaquinone biosynthesis C-methylase UbiE